MFKPFLSKPFRMFSHEIDAPYKRMFITLDLRDNCDVKIVKISPKVYLEGLESVDIQNSNELMYLTTSS